MKNKLPKLTEDQFYPLSKGLAGAVFRNGAVEDLHSQGAVLDDEPMCILNHNVCNRMYAILKLAFSTDARDHKILDKTSKLEGGIYTMKNITIRHLINELAKRSADFKDAEIISIGTASGMSHGMKCPYVIRYKDSSGYDRLLYIPSRED